MQNGQIRFHGHWYLASKLRMTTDIKKICLHCAELINEDKNIICKIKILMIAINNKKQTREISNDCN